MEIYIEYALIENFLYDFTLLMLAFMGARIKVKWRNLVFSACVGAIFAVIYPLLRLPVTLGVAVKMATGALLCLLAFPRISTRQQWGRYLLTTALFFAFSFGFGGTLLVVYGPLSMGEKVPSYLVFIGFSLLLALGVWLVKRLYARRAIFRRVYTCTLSSGENHVEADGFYDSGNLATKNGVPVCFVSPALIYDLIGEEILKTRGQVCDEMQISTLTGEKTVPLYEGNITIKVNKKPVCARTYFAPSAHMIGREYTVLLNARLLERESEDAIG
ncbi:MAG: sigma-E processing peptidase SpoIIGA [Clostridia bacterium]|nr:sigma-E processing peptidase SpoIIGA [Clostridia bacterium]